MTTHNWTPEQVQNARESIFADMIKNAYAVRISAPYASHVTLQRKADNLAEHILLAHEALQGKHDWTVWYRQLITYKITGKVIAILP